MDKLDPMNNRVLVRRAKPKEKSVGGIIVPDTAKEKELRGEVLAVSKGKRLRDGSFRPHDFKVGDVIVFEKFADTDLSEMTEQFGPDVALVEGDDVLGVEVPS